VSAARPTLPIAAALVSGAMIWFASSELAHTREAWDADVYWHAAYPFALAFCGALGWLFPERAWRWAPLHFLGQFLALCIRNGELGNLWPLGLIVFGAISLPGVALAAITGHLARRTAPDR
jgi:hypothetical protein